MHKFRVIISFIIVLFLMFFAVTFKYINNNKNIDTVSFSNPVRIVFITDNNYTKYMRTAIRSIIANKLPETEVEISIIGVDLSDKNINKILNNNKKDVKINIIKLTESDLLNFQSGSLFTPGVSRADNAKFLLTSILKNYDKVIYLDGDIIVLKDLSEMYNTDLGDNYVAAADDWQSSWFKNPNKRYFNNGVMLLNLKKMRVDNIEQKLQDFKKNDEVKRFVTQDAFNTVMYGKVLFLPLIYDTFAPEYDSKYFMTRIEEALGDNYDANLYPYTNKKEFQKDVVIIHYCGFYNEKPWKKLDFTRDSNRIWYKYAPIDFWLSFRKFLKSREMQKNSK